MGEQLFDGDVVGIIRALVDVDALDEIVGKVVCHGIVQGELTLFVQAHDRGSGIEFGDAGEVDGRIRRHRRLPVLVSDTGRARPGEGAIPLLYRQNTIPDVLVIFNLAGNEMIQFLVYSIKGRSSQLEDGENNHTGYDQQQDEYY